jgi:FKBP-type peptidyl-prolyl cis-trans isomerase 2
MFLGVGTEAKVRYINNAGKCWFMKKGDFIKIDFVGRVVNTGEVFDLTEESEARKAGIHNPDRKYTPMLAIIGSGMLVPGVESELEKMKVGEGKEFNVSPDRGFGSRRMDNIRIISLAKFRENKINPIPGEFVEIDGRRARVQSVSGGRIRVDFNHPLAGKELNYRVRIVKVIKDAKEKADSLLEHYGIECETELKESVLVITTKKPLHELVRKMIGEEFKKWIAEIKSLDFRSKEKAKKDVRESQGESPG